MKPLKIFLALGIIAAFAFTAPNHEPRKIKIVLDAAHGGKDWGATHENITEKEITEQIAYKIKSQNKNENIVFELTRLDDNNLSLQDRTALINKIKPDLVLSLHVSANKNASASGFEIFTPKSENANSKTSTVYAEKLSNKLIKNHNLKSRGVKEAPFHILNKSEVPAIVVELGFISNASDRAYLTDAAQQERIANTILEFVTDMQ